MKRTALLGALILAVATTSGVAAVANEVIVAAGGVLDLGTGSLGLDCADLTVAGTLSAGTVGFDSARDVTIAPTGVLNGNSAVLEVAGEWDDAGTFNAGTSAVRFVDGCGLLSAVIAGDTTFATLDLTTTTGKLYRFTAGSTQIVTQLLTLAGAVGNRLRLRSTLDGSEAFLNLQGAHSASFVDVADNHAIGNPIALGPDSIKGSNTPGWQLAAAVPALSTAGRTALALALLWIAREVALYRRGRQRPGREEA